MAFGFAHAAWCCADVCEPDIPVAEQARKVRLMCDAYGWDDPPAVIDEIADRFQRARNDHAAHQRLKAVAVFDEMIAWMKRHAPALKGRTLKRAPLGRQPASTRA